MASSATNLPIDPAEKRQLFERLSNVREVVFGMQDGVLTTAGVLCGLSGAVSDHKQVILAALASTAAGALSMGVGAYLGTHAEGEILGAELQQARREAADHPYVIQESLLDQLSKEGLSRDAAYRVVKLMSTAPEVLISTAEEKVYGLGAGRARQCDRRRRGDGNRICRRCAGSTAAVFFYRKRQKGVDRSSGRNRFWCFSLSDISKDGSPIARSDGAPVSASWLSR